jgi:hypothetical protein
MKVSIVQLLLRKRDPFHLNPDGMGGPVAGRDSRPNGWCYGDVVERKAGARNKRALRLADVFFQARVCARPNNLVRYDFTSGPNGALWTSSMRVPQGSVI